NDREIGSLFGIVQNRPEFGNFFGFNIARVSSPRAWLSTWSALSSRGDFMSSAAHLRIPTLFVAATGDSDIRPPEASEMWESIGAPDKTRTDLVGADHYLRSIAARSSADPRAVVVDVIDAWMRARFAR